MSYFVRYFLIPVLLGTHVYLEAENVSSRSFLSAQPFSMVSADMTYSMIMDQYHEKGSVLNRPQVQASVFYGGSLNSQDIAEYFLLNNKQSLKVNEATSNDVDTVQDIIALNFNVLTENGDYSSLLSFDPEQKYYGVTFSSRYSFSERAWLHFQLPFLSITNDLKLKDKVINSPTGNISSYLGFDGKHITASSMIEAFRQKEMLYGKIDGPQTKRGFGDTTLMLGYDFEDRSERYLAPYIGVTLPTSNKPKGEYVWEPVLGNNKHLGIFAGAYGHSQIYEKQTQTLWFTWSFKNEYLFSNIQKRSFDLHRGPWTRYLAMYKNENDRISGTAVFGYGGIKTFGINLMTQDTYVSPGFSNTSTMSLSYVNNNIHATLGASSYIREAEKLKLVHAWEKGPSVASFGGDNACSSLRTIGTMCLEDGEAERSMYITQEDINFQSAAAANVISGGVYATVGYYNATSNPQLYEIGCSYESSCQNSAINRYALWAKFQITF